MSTPLLGDIPLQYAQQIEYRLETGFAATPIASLPGELLQHAGRRSHRIRIAGLLFGETAADDLKTLQEAAEQAQEVNFSADITAALDLQKVVITQLAVVASAGQPDRYAYELELVESPPLPPPAQVESFGGLDDFGLGDLGFDTDVLGDLQALADEVAGAVDDALQVIDQLSALTSLDGLNLGNVLEPLAQPVDQVTDLASDFGAALDGLRGALGS